MGEIDGVAGAFLQARGNVFGEAAFVFDEEKAHSLLLPELG